jgi:phosphoglycerate dehydrogenase-like enzyme
MSIWQGGGHEDPVARQHRPRPRRSGRRAAVVYAVDKPVPDEHTDAEALVVWGNPAAQLRDAARRLSRVRWVQTLAAGPDAVLAAGFAPDVVITGGTGLHDLTVAEHALALTLAAARRLNLLVRAQVGHRWAGELGGLQPVDDPTSFRTLRGARVLIWGFGGIAATLAPYLSALGARVTGVARSAGSGTLPGDHERRPARPAAADRRPGDDPAATPDTAAALDARILALLPAHAWVVNVGRGSTVDEAPCSRRSGPAGSAARRWTSSGPSRCPRTPAVGRAERSHLAARRRWPADRRGARIAENLAAFRSGGPFTNVVER